MAASDNDYAASDNRRRNARAEKGHPSLTLDVPSLYNERISTHRQCIALVVDVEAKVDELALHVATERLNYELKRGNFFKKAWKHLSEEVYRQRYMAEERTDIVRQIRNIQGADLGATSNTSQRFSNNERLAILERFNAGLCDSDESRRGLSSSLGSALEAKLKELMINYRNGKIDRQGFVDEKSKLFGEKSPVIDNLAEIADQLNVNQIRSLEFVHAQASGSIKEVDHLTVFDRAFNSLKKIPVFGQLLSPIPAAVAFCSLTFVFEGTARRLVPIGALVLGGVLAAWKRRLAVTHDVAHQRRAQTAGFKSANKAYGMFEQIDALDLASSLREIREDGLDGSDKVSLENSERLLGARRGQKRPAGASSLEQAIDLIAKVEAHAHIGRQVKHDLIQYAGPGTVEQNRLELLQEVAEMKVAIRESEANLYLANGVIRELGKYWYDEISKKIESFESDFKGYRRRESLKAGLYGAATGALFGAVTYGISWLLGNILNGHIKIPKLGGDSDEAPQGALDKIFSLGSPDQTAGQQFHGRNIETISTEHQSFVLPESYDVRVSDGLATIAAADGSYEINSLALDSSGALSEEALAALENQGWEVHSMAGEPTFHQMTSVLSAHDLISSSPDSVVDIGRKVWYEHGGNPLELKWGGVDGSGIAENGDYVFSVSGMTPSGSHVDSQSVDIETLLAQGEAYLLISPSEGTQAQPFSIPIMPNGEAHISPESLLGTSLFEKGNDGLATCKARFVEVAHPLTGGFNSDVSTSIGVLATYEGQGIEEVSVQLEQRQELLVHELHPPQRLNQLAEGRFSDDDWLIFVPIPLSKRKPIDNLDPEVTARS